MTSNATRPPRLFASPRLGALVIVVLALAVSGCVRLAPYQRGRLAHPTMLLGELSTPGEAHVYAIQEGAVGGGSAVEGGCGCN